MHPILKKFHPSPHLKIHNLKMIPNLEIALTPQCPTLHILFTCHMCICSQEPTYGLPVSKQLSPSRDMTLSIHPKAEQHNNICPCHMYSPNLGILPKPVQIYTPMISKPHSSSSFHLEQLNSPIAPIVTPITR